jgi:malate permease and related proteins
LSSLLLNAFGLGQHLPGVVRHWLKYVGDCYVPLSVLLIGASIADLLGKEKINWAVASVSPIIRLALIPLAYLAAAKWLPVGQELQRVLLVQAAMPSAVFGIVLARMYGGHPATAMHVVLSTTLLSLITTPLFVQAGAHWLGLSFGQP